MSPGMPTLDPITLEIIWNGLKSINDESWFTIQQSAFSTNIKERHDHSTAIADAQGRLIAQAEMSLPIHLASLLDLMRILVARYGDDIAEGDLFIANDPHVAGGTHLPDINMAMPVFADGRIYFLSEEGVATVIAPGPEFRLLSTSRLDGATLASMAISDKSIFIRTDSHLYRIGAGNR